MATQKQPTLAQWRAIYDAAIRLKKLAPWEFMEETDIFGVQDPKTGRVGFVSVMGARGEHFGIAAYIDPLALYQFWTFAEYGEEMDPVRLFEIEQLTLSYEDRDMLDKEDRAVIKKLGLRFRGRNAWPVFRKITPGYLPWFIDAEDAPFLRHILEQTLDVTQRLRKQPHLLDIEDEDSIEYLIRVPRETETGLVWEDEWREVPLPETSLEWKLDEELLARVKKLPQIPNMVEMELFPLLFPVAADEGRPFIPYVMLVVDRKSGMILDAGLNQPMPDYWGLLENLPNLILTEFIRLGGIPQRIYVRTDTLTAHLEFLKQFLPFEVIFSSNLRHLESAKEGLQEFLG